MSPKTTLDRARKGMRAEYGRIDGDAAEIGFQFRLHRQAGLKAARDLRDRERMEAIFSRWDGLLRRLAQI